MKNSGVGTFSKKSKEHGEFVLQKIENIFRLTCYGNDSIWDKRTIFCIVLLEVRK